MLKRCFALGRENRINAILRCEKPTIKPSVEKKVKVDSLKPLFKLVGTERWRFSGLVVLTLFHSSLLLCIPFAFKELTRLSNLRLKVEDNTTQTDTGGDSDPELDKDELKTIYESVKGFFNMKSGGESDSPFSSFMGATKKEDDEGKGPIYVSKRELLHQYNKFFLINITLLSCVGIIGYKRNVLSRKIDNLLAILLRRKLYDEVLLKNQSLIFGKDVNPSAVTLRIITNIENVSRDLMGIFTGLGRGASFVGGGSALMIYYIPEFTLLSIGFIGSLSILAKWYNAKIFKSASERQATLSEISKYIGDQASNIKTVVSI